MDVVLTEIKITFANHSGFVVVPAEYLLRLTVQGVKDVRNMKGIFGLKRQRTDTAAVISKSKFAETIDIVIANSAAGKIFTDKGAALFDRIKFNDIVSVALKYADGTVEIIFADYHPNTDTGENEIQYSSVDGDGDLWISVGKSDY